MKNSSKMKLNLSFKLVLFHLFFIHLLNAQAFITHEFESKKALVYEFKPSCEKINYGSQMQAYQACVDRIIEKDSTVAYLWQRKAMPYFKALKFEVGMPYIDLAVKYDRRNWLSYRAFIKTVFARTYHSALDDLNACINEYGNEVVMDHSYQFYKGLSHLQLNQFEEAKKAFNEAIIYNHTQTTEHHMEYFYLGIAYFEMFDYVKASENFEKALKLYPEFPEPQYYLALAKYHSGKIDYNAFYKMYEIAKANYDKGYLFNESNAVHVRYPYQLNWK